MMHQHTRLGQWLMVLIPLLMTAGCVKNPNVYFSTGTTVGLEATPPTTETPPHVTFGYKRAELALIPVRKLNKQHESQKPYDKIELPFLLSERGCTKGPFPAQVQNDDNPNKTTDAFSVLASFHLAVNWFGPAKIEQHFATGCTATNLIHGMMEEEEDKRLAEEAQTEVREAKTLLQTTVTRATALLTQATNLEKAIGKTMDLAESLKAQTGDREKNLKQMAIEIGTHEYAAKRLNLERLDLETDVKNRIDDAKAKAKSGIDKAEKAKRTEAVRSQAEKSKTEANKLIENIKDSERSVSEKIDTIHTTLTKIRGDLDKIGAARTAYVDLLGNNSVRP